MNPYLYSLLFTDYFNYSLTTSKYLASSSSGVILLKNLIALLYCFCFDFCP